MTPLPADPPTAAGSGRRGRERALPALVVLGIAALVVWRTGPGKIPNVVGFEGIARFWPLYPVEPVQAYVLRQSLGQGLYRALGWTGTGHFLVLHLIALAVAAGVLSLWLLHRLGGQRGAIAICLLLLSPVTVVLLEWIGMYDAFSVLVWILLLVSLRWNPAVQGAVAILGGLQNFEQFMVSIVLLALLPEAARAQGLRARPVALVIGAVIGKVALELYLANAGAVDGSRASFLAEGEMQYLVLSTFAALAPVIVWSLLGGLWVPVARWLPTVWSPSASLRYRAIAAAVVVLGVGIVAADHTRVMVLVTFPLLVLLCMALATAEESVRGWLRRPDTWLVIATPALVVWSGTVLPLGLDLAVWGM